MNRILRSAILVLLACPIGYAQTNFQEGYIKKTNGEIVKGFIDNRDWVKNPNEILFKVSETGTNQSFDVEDLTEFVVNNDLFRSAVVKVSLLARHEETNTAAIEVEEKEVFLRMLVTGSKELYYYQSQLETDHFYIKQGLDYELLEYKEYVKGSSGNTKLIAKNRKYIGQLVVYLTGCGESQKILSSTKYAVKSLKSAFYKYYECIGETVVKDSRKEVLTKINLLSGVSMTQVKFESDVSGFKYLDQGTFEVSTQPVLGVGVDFVIPRGREKWAISTELLYKSYRVNWNYDVYTHPEVYRLGQYEMGISYLQVNVMMRYAYPVSEQVSLIVKGGLAYGNVINEVNEKNVLYRNYVDERIDEGKALDDVKGIELGFNVGLGLSYRRFYFDWRIERTKGMSVYAGLASPILYNYFILGFQLSK
jgi:hypothetical protein